MVCLDIDGTLLQYDGTMHDVTRDAVQATDSMNQDLAMVRLDTSRS